MFIFCIVLKVREYIYTSIDVVYKKFVVLRALCIVS